MDLSTRLLKEKEYLLSTLKKIRHQLQGLPEGKLRIERNGKYDRYVWVRKTASAGRSQKTYLPNDQMLFISTLAFKTFLVTRESDILKRLNAIEWELKTSKKIIPPDNSAWKTLMTNHVFRSLIPLDKLSLVDELAAWQVAPYPRSTSHPETLTIEMQDGTMCRSKSERAISDELIRYGIPYRYECPISLGGRTITPDFIVRNRRTGDTFIQEHFGRMEDQSYFENNFVYKMRLYIANGYVPGVNLLTTYETSSQPLNISQIRSLIEAYLL